MGIRTLLHCDKTLTCLFWQMAMEETFSESGMREELRARKSGSLNEVEVEENLYDDDPM